MSSKIFATLTLAVVLGHAQSACFSSCEFKFCDHETSFDLSTTKPDKAFTRAICKEGIRVGHVDSTGEAYVQSKSGPVRISEYKPEGLRQRFSPSFFKSFGLYKHHKYSGIGHETPQANQADFLDELCFAVPITAFQVLDKHRRVIDNVAPSKNEALTACVAFSVVFKEDKPTPTPIPTPAPSNIVYAALGDSFSSGNGVPDCEENCDGLFYRFGGNGTECSQSTRAFGPVLAGETGADFSFLACSGADTGEFLREQLEPLKHVGADVATLTLGGNDVGLSFLVGACLFGEADCDKDPILGAVVDARLRSLRGESVEGDQELLLPGAQSLEKVYKAILKAGVKRLIVFTYPLFLEPAVGPDGELVCLFAPGLVSVEEAIFMNEAGRIANDAIRSAVKALGDKRIELVELEPLFKGHSLCGDDPFFTGLDAEPEVSRLHPNEFGNAIYLHQLRIRGIA